MEVSDAEEEDTGSITLAELVMRGVPILDTDNDGLDDDWENSFFAGLARGPRDDDDGDGYNNAREQIMGTDPTAVNDEFRVDASPVRAGVHRLSWPGRTNRSYEVLSTSNLGAAWTTNTVAGEFPETERILNSTLSERQFFRIREVAP